jgi:DNA invertase Pin-like site-specific DNA recombinase
VFGNRHGRRKLTAAQVVEIRELVASGNSHALVASQFGVSRSAITLISQRKTWNK